MLGVKRGTVTLSPYDPEWEFEFEKEKALLLEHFGARIKAIEHIGSTAIPGIPAKPIIDMNIAVDSIDEIDDFIAGLQQLGYEYIPERRYADRQFFPKGPAECRTHHLNLVELESETGWKNALRFRDYLRTHTDAREAYRILKETLAEQYANDREGYTEQKSAFVHSILAKASGASVIIPTLNEEHYLPDLLASLQHVSMPLEIIVVDGNSEDGTASVVEKFESLFPENVSLTLVRSERGIGLQRNKGAAQAAYPTLVFCDADITFPLGHCEQIVSEFVRNRYAVAAPVMRPLEPGIQFRLIYRLAYLLQRISLVCHRPYFAGACLVTTKDTFQRVGGFDTAVMLGEDVDYSLRASKVGSYALIRTPVHVSARRIIRYGYWWAIKELPTIIRFVFTGKIAHAERMFYPFGDFGGLKR